MMIYPPLEHCSQSGALVPWIIARSLRLDRHDRVDRTHPRRRNDLTHSAETWTYVEPSSFNLLGRMESFKSTATLCPREDVVSITG